MKGFAKIFGHAGDCMTIACAIHCLALPVLISFLPAMGFKFLHHCWMESILLSLAIGFTLISLCWGYHTHRRLRAFAFLAAGAIWLIIAHHTYHDTALSLLGGICLIAANLTNRKLCRTCSYCCEHEHRITE